MVRSAPGSDDAALAARAAGAGVLALPGALTAYFAFNAGGFFPETPAFVAVVLTLLLVVRITTADDPFAGFSRPLAVAAVALGLYCVWALLSATWSDAPARALIEFDRALMYLLALVLFGSVPRTAGALRWMVRGVALAMVAVIVAAFLTRTLPDEFTFHPGLDPARLGWPLTYWNALGILGGLGAIFCLHLSSSLREPLPVRVLAAAAVPAIGATVLLTFSRGGIGAGLVGLVVYALVGRPRGLVSALIAVVPLGMVAVNAAYDATLLASNEPINAATITEGHDLARVVALCCAGAAALRLVLALFDRQLLRLRLPSSWRPQMMRAAWAGGALLAVAALLALDVPDRIGDQYDRFVHNDRVEHATETRARLTGAGDTGRLDHWDVALAAFGEHELRGEGAATFGPYWMRERPISNQLIVDDAHSLYFETLAELGLVGIVLLAVLIVSVLVAFAPIRRGRNRPVYAVMLAAGLAWALHTGIDWDWEMPAVTIWFFCLGGAALATHVNPEGRARAIPTSGARVVVGGFVLTAAIAPALVLVSQHQLDDAADAFEAGDCDRAMDRAAASIRTLEIRAEPYEVLGLCDVRLGFDRLAVEALERAVDRDPANWELRYTEAIVRGSAGLDPRAAAREARRQNPHDVLTRSLVRYVDTDDPRRWIERTRPIAQNERLSVVD
jgi:O-antigen ligase